MNAPGAGLGRGELRPEVSRLARPSGAEQEETLRWHRANQSRIHDLRSCAVFKS